MSTRSRPFVRRALSLAVAASALAAFALLAIPRASSSEPALEPELRATYPRTELPAGSLAGIDLDGLVLPGLRLAAREDHAVDDGGVVLSYVDAAGTVRAVITIAVAPDAAAARRFVDVALHGIASPLPAADPSLGDFAFADDGGRGDAIVVGASTNVAFIVRALREGGAAGLPSARDVVLALKGRAVEGAPSFPVVDVRLPSVVDAKTGADLRVTTVAGAKPKLRAEGAYVAHGKGAPRLKPFAPGPVAVIATVADALGRVTEARAIAVAK